MNTNKVALITGASSGIGKAIAIKLSDIGFRVILSGRDERRLMETANYCTESFPVAGDLQHSVIQDLLVNMVFDLRRLDVLVHSAAIHRAALTEMMAINVGIPLDLTTKLTGALVATQGDVVFINSSQGYLSASGATLNYSASKHALRATADSLRAQLNPRGVRVLSVFPGRTATAMQEAIYKDEGKPYDPRALIQPSDIAMLVSTAVMLPRTAELTDIHVRPRRPPGGP